MLGEIVNSGFGELTPEDRTTMTSGGSVHMGNKFGFTRVEGFDVQQNIFASSIYDRFRCRGTVY